MDFIVALIMMQPSIDITQQLINAKKFPKIPKGVLAVIQILYCILIEVELVTLLQAFLGIIM